MNLYFNDLTVSNDAAADLLKLREFVALFRQFQLKTGESHVWVSKATKEYFSALQWTKANILLWQWINSTFNLRSSESPVEPEGIEEHFISSDFTIDIAGESVSCGHMGIAALTKPRDSKYSLTVGLNDDDFWSRLRYVVRESTVSHKVYNHDALCLTREQDVSDGDVVQWCHCAYNVALPICELAPHLKGIHIRDDHGKDVLMKFAKRLVSSSYVVEVVNSLPFNPHAIRFVESIDVDSKVLHLRLCNDDRGLGLAVRVTGENRDHLARIAKLLTDKFSYQ